MRFRRRNNKQQQRNHACYIVGIMALLKEFCRSKVQKEHTVLCPRDVKPLVK